MRQSFFGGSGVLILRIITIKNHRSQNVHQISFWCEIRCPVFPALRSMRQATPASKPSKSSQYSKTPLLSTTRSISPPPPSFQPSKTQSSYPLNPPTLHHSNPPPLPQTHPSQPPQLPPACVKKSLSLFIFTNLHLFIPQKLYFCRLNF